MSIETESKIDTYDESEVECITVKNHWSNKRLVVIQVGKTEVAVAADDLRRAISNATNR